MKKFAKKDLIDQAKKLIDQGYKKLTGTNDGQFFTDLELATAHAKNIDSEVFKFSSEDFANVPEADTENVIIPAPVVAPAPAKKKDVTKTKKK